MQYNLICMLFYCSLTTKKGSQTIHFPEKGFGFARTGVHRVRTHLESP